MPSIIFDIDDTMYDRLSPFGLAYEKIFGSRWKHQDLRPLFHSFIRHGNEVFEDAMNRRITMEQMYIFRISQAMKDFGAQITPTEALQFQEAYLWQQNHLLLHPALKELLDDCRQRGRFLAIITNGPSAHQRIKIYALGLEQWIPEKYIMASGDVGINKPDPGIFRVAQEKWNLNLKDTWYVGDSYEHDIISARSAGWHTIWLDRKYESVAGHSPEAKKTSAAPCPSAQENRAVRDFSAAEAVVHTEEELRDFIQKL